MNHKIQFQPKSYSSQPTGREILELANLTPPENYTLRVKVVGKPPSKVELADRIDLRQPGVEKFKAQDRNINRILNSTVADAQQRRPKAEVLADAIHQLGLELAFMC